MAYLTNQAEALARIVALYPALAQVEPPLSTLAQARHPLQVGTGTPLFAEHAPCQGFPLVLEGEVKVSRHASDGRSLELYRVLPGELCLASCAALFRTQPLIASGVASQPSTLLLIGADAFAQWLNTPAFRDSVLGLFAERMAELAALIDAVAFQRLDTRLAAALLGHGPTRHTTHQALADELGTVREMVTRLLRRFEREGWVRVERECIHVSNAAALRNLSHPRG